MGTINIPAKKEKTAIGNDRVYFQLSNNNLATQDLEKVASGGELSRILLALKVSLVKQTSGLALIFAVDRPLDMCRTVVNITGDATVSMFVDKIISKKWILS